MINTGRAAGLAWAVLLAAGFVATTLAPPAEAQSGTVQAIRYGEITGVRQVVIEMRRSGRSAPAGRA